MRKITRGLVHALHTAVQHFEYQASQSNDLAEFKSRTGGVIAPADQQRLFELLEKFGRIYDELIWNPNLNKLIDYGKNLKAAWEKGKLTSLFSKTGKFYGSVWPDNHQFMVRMVPIPAEKGNTSATVIDNAIILECMLGEKDIAGTVGVIFHETAHSAFEAQSLELQIELHDWFIKHTSKYRTLVQNLLNEGLATALGNGFAYSEISGKENENSWYNDKEIDFGAKANSEIVRRYVRKEKRIDKSFVNDWIKTYEKTFPDGPRDTAVRLGEIFLFIDGAEYKWQEVKPDVKKAFKPFSMWAYQPISTPDGLTGVKSEIEQKPLGPALVYILSNVASKDHLNQHLALIPDLKPALTTFHERLAKADSQKKPFSVLDYENGRLIYIIWAPTADQLRQQLNTLKQIPIASETVTIVE